MPASWLTTWADALHNLHANASSLQCVHGGLDPHKLAGMPHIAGCPKSSLPNCGHPAEHAACLLSKHRLSAEQCKRSAA